MPTQFSSQDFTGAEDGARAVWLPMLLPLALPILILIVPLIDLVLAQCGTKGRAQDNAPHVGFRRVQAGHSLVIKEAGRRAGDPPTLIGEAARIRDVLGWEPQYDDLAAIVSSALNWERKLAAGVSAA